MNDAKLPTTPDIPRLAEYAYEHYYSKPDDVQALRDAQESDETLSDIIAFDIRDLLHNGNIEDIFDTTNLTDADIDALSDRFHTDFDQLTELSDFIATIINTHHTI